MFEHVYENMNFDEKLQELEIEIQNEKKEHIQEAQYLVYFWR